MIAPETQHEWIAMGIRRGWCGPPVCVIHDGIPATHDETEQLDEGLDPCIHMMRPYHDSIEQLVIEDNHPETNARKRNFLES
jgi:hypothetical protein